MSVLPQLQQELSAAHARRRRRRRPRLGFGFGGASVALAGAVALAVVVVAVALVHGRSPERTAGSPTIVYRGFADDFYAAGGSLYAITSDQPEGSPLVGEPPHLVRVDPGSGRVVARQSLAPPPTSQGQPVPAPQRLLLAAGSLWATASDSQQTWLWRLDPRSLKVRSLSLVPGGGAGVYSGSLAVAGGWLWVVNRNTLVHVSPTTGRVAGSRTFSRSQVGLGNGVAADQSGRTLVLTVMGATRGTHVELLNPVTGVPIASSAKFSGVTPQLGGVLDGGAWIDSLAFAGGPVRLDLRTLKVTTRLGRAALPGLVFDGVVTANGSGGWRCVDPVTGRPLARIPTLVAAEGTTAYVQTKRGAIPEISRVTLDPRCLATP
ncbi:MAG TPA: hypothetical protein VFH80_05300 [Solirubrobacteraceae bacterium]|nr:hypothetical protein [Solirubrobacteraceae bacterium]